MSAVVDDWQHLIGDVSDIADAARSPNRRSASDVTFVAGAACSSTRTATSARSAGRTSTLDALRRVPDLEIEVPDAGCCGMAGAFGYRADRYDLSVAMGERVLAPAVRATDADVIATGTSCRHQIGDLTQRDGGPPVAVPRSRRTS